ncbi:Coiled-coil domain-containing protein 84 [Mactra antiquata]
MDQFFYDNLLKKELKPRYVLSLEDLYIFKKAAFLAVKKWQKNDEVSRKVVAESIAVTEHKRLSESTSGVSSLNHEERVSLGNMPGTSGTSQSSSQGNNMINNGIRKTVSAKGEGLTCVLRQDNEEREEGNVHTGALPPWLTPDTTNNHTTQIGPTIEDYQKHLEREKKAKLPPNRVGAKFDHTADMSSDWLPSFGRVWSKGRRLQSKQHFEKNWKKGSKSIGNSRKSQTSDHVGSSSKAGVTFHKEKSDWSESKSGANQNQLSSNSATLNYSNFSSSNHTVPYKRQNRNELDVKSSVIDGNYDHSNNTSNHTVPYKRKNTEQNVTASVIGGIHSGSTSSDSIQPIIPYKRKRNNDSCNSVNLIHTPVLSESDRK